MPFPILGLVRRLGESSHRLPEVAAWQRSGPLGERRTDARLNHGLRGASSRRGATDKPSDEQHRYSGLYETTVAHWIPPRDGERTSTINLDRGYDQWVIGEIYAVTGHEALSKRDYPGGAGVGRHFQNRTHALGYPPQPLLLPEWARSRCITGRVGHGEQSGPQPFVDWPHP